MSGELTTADLNRNHLGVEILVEGTGFVVHDVLAGVNHNGDLISDATWSSPDSVFLGRQYTTLQFLHSSDVRCSGTEKVTIFGVRAS